MRYILINSENEKIFLLLTNLDTKYLKGGFNKVWKQTILKIKNFN